MDGLKDSFDAISSRYDGHRSWIVPDFTGFYAAAVGAAASSKENPSILDIGAGTGLLSEMLLEACPGATITLLDISEKMLEVAKVRFPGRRNVRFITADYRRGGLEGSYDVICSALSIHHLEREEKRELYRRIFGALGKAGVFVNADEVAGESEALHRENLDSWDAFLRNGPLGKEEAEAVIRRRETFDRMERLSVQLGWLSEIGFVDVKVPYRNRTFAVMCGRKENAAGG
jgi:tRNA (cmo5U34)-methyltransferase